MPLAILIPAQYQFHCVIPLQHWTHCSESRRHLPLSPPPLYPLNLGPPVPHNRVPLVARYLAYEVLAYLGSPNRLTVSEPAPSPLTVMAPVREELVTADATTLWQAAGYNRDLYLRSQLAISFSRRHTNRAWDLRMPYHMTY